MTCLVGPLLDLLWYIRVCLVQNRGQHSQCGLISAEWPRGEDQSLHLLAMLFLMQPMDTADHLCRKVSNRTTPRSFSAELPSSHAGPSLYWLFLPRCGMAHLPLLTVSCEMPVCSFRQPVDIPLNSSTAICCISHSSWFCVNCKATEGALSPIIQVINEDATQDWSHY